MTHESTHGLVCLGSGVYALRHADLDLTTGLVVGQCACLVIDTGVDDHHGAELAALVRTVTAAPWSVVLTHGHFDHCFGTAAFGQCEVVAHEACAGYQTRALAGQRAEWGAAYPRIREIEPMPPTSTIDDTGTIDLGGRLVQLHHFGPAHTDHDLVVQVPDAGVVFAGDLTEQGAPPSIGPDASPRDWPDVLDRLLELRPETVVPGHGEPVGPGFVRAQRDELRARFT